MLGKVPILFSAIGFVVSLSKETVTKSDQHFGKCG